MGAAAVAVLVVAGISGLRPEGRNVTVEDRYVFDVGDIKTVRCDCNACGAAMSVALTAWKGPLPQCPSCYVEWENNPQHNEMMKGFALALRSLAGKGQPGYRLRFEIDRPKI
jgi:hypothetical protein